MRTLRRQCPHFAIQQFASTLVGGAIGGSSKSRNDAGVRVRSWPEAVLERRFLPELNCVLRLGSCERPNECPHRPPGPWSARSKNRQMRLHRKLETQTFDPGSSSRFSSEELRGPR